MPHLPISSEKKGEGGGKKDTSIGLLVDEQNSLCDYSGLGGRETQAQSLSTWLKAVSTCHLSALSGFCKLCCHLRVRISIIDCGAGDSGGF